LAIFARGVAVVGGEDEGKSLDFFVEEFSWFLQGFLRKMGGTAWCFDGEVVVKCVVKLVF
jgi:hypothetical protein